MASPLVLVPALLLSAPSLLQSATVRREEGVVRAPALRDGKATWEGDFWDTEATALIKPAGAMEWDLGESRVIKAGLLQADNNDDYLVQVSDDGEHWTVAWKPIPDPIAGMRTRTSTTLDARGRYVRLTASGGDNLYSVGELALYSDPADLTPDAVVRAARPPPLKKDVPLDTTWWFVLVCVAGVVLFFTRKRWDLGEAEGDAAPTAPASDAAPAAPAPAAESTPAAPPPGADAKSGEAKPS